jgi:outer membrane lipase/esterase
MKKISLYGALIAACVLSACGGGGGVPKYTSVVSFGDSLSDAGAYRVGGIQAAGGGLFTVNGVEGDFGADPAPSFTWAQLVALAGSGKVSCSARVGGFTVPVSTVVGCTNYAQGGSRVSDAKGVGNEVGGGDFSRALTEPVTTQIANYVAAGGAFSAKQLFTVQAGANDLFTQLEVIKVGAAAAAKAARDTSLVNQLAAGALAALKSDAGLLIRGAITAESAKATATDATVLQAAFAAALAHASSNSYTNSAAVQSNIAAIGVAAATAALTAANTFTTNTGIPNATVAMTLAATQLANAVKDLQTKGAQVVTVLNIPDASQSPSALATITYNPDKTVKDNASQQLFLALTTQFNTTLKTALESTPGVMRPGVVYVDAFAENQRQVASPADYGLSNVTATACNLNLPGNILAKAGEPDSGSSLVCNTNNLKPGDVSRYLFADGVHPTPYGHKLIADFVIKNLKAAGRL